MDASQARRDQLRAVERQANEDAYTLEDEFEQLTARIRANENTRRRTSDALAAMRNVATQGLAWSDQLVEVAPPSAHAASQGAAAGSSDEMATGSATPPAVPMTVKSAAQRTREDGNDVWKSFYCVFCGANASRARYEEGKFFSGLSGMGAHITQTHQKERDPVSGLQIGDLGRVGRDKIFAMCERTTIALSPEVAAKLAKWVVGSKEKIVEMVCKESPMSEAGVAKLKDGNDVQLLQRVLQGDVAATSDESIKVQPGPATRYDGRAYVTGPGQRSEAVPAHCKARKHGAPTGDKSPSAATTSLDPYSAYSTVETTPNDIRAPGSRKTATAAKMDTCRPARTEAQCAASTDTPYQPPIRPPLPRSYVARHAGVPVIAPSSAFAPSCKREQSTHQSALPTGYQSPGFQQPAIRPSRVAVKNHRRYREDSPFSQSDDGHDKSDPEDRPEKVLKTAYDGPYSRSAMWQKLDDAQ